MTAGDREVPLLEVRDVRTSFATDRGELRAVDGVSFSLARGRTLGIVGESGSGKTVLSRTVMGLLGGAGVRQSGSVRFEGREMIGAPPAALRSVWGARIGMVFQDPTASLSPVVRIGRQITESLRAHLQMDRADAKAMAVGLLGQVGIPAPEQRFHSYPGELSGGMRQRVAIAIAIACTPRLLLADEPTTGLDVTVRAQILDLLAALRAERRMAMVLVSHDVGVVAARTDEVLVMYAGRVVEQAPTRTLFASTAMPYTAALLGATPRLADPSHTRLTAIGGRPPDLVDRARGCPFAPRCPYVQERCRREAPPLVDAEAPGHRYACWFPLGFRRGPAPAGASR
jgi:peptide/nickel transport system ATP-binding protein